MRGATEAKVGVVVVLALTAMGGGYLFLRGMSLGADSYRLRLLAPANIAKGSDIRLQGVKVGVVENVTLDEETQKPLLTLAIKHSTPEFKLLKTYHYSIRSDSLIGENYVDIRGAYDPAAAVFTPGDPNEVIQGTPTVAIADVTDVVNSLGKDFRVTLQKLNVTIERVNKGVLSYDNQVRLAQALENVTKLSQKAGQSFDSRGFKIGFGDPAAQRALTEALNNAALASREARGVMDQAKGAARNLNSLTAQFQSITNENRGELKSLLHNLSGTAQNVSGLTQSLNFFLSDPSFKQNSVVAMQSLRRTAENIEAGTAGFKSLAGDPATQKDLRDTLSALRITSESLRDTAGTIKNVVANPENQAQLSNTFKVLTDTAGGLKTTISNLNEITGGLKNIVADPALAANIKASTENLNGTLAATRAAAERVNSLLGGKRPTKVVNPDGTTTETQPVTKISSLPTGLDFTYRNFASVSGGPRTGNDVSGRHYGDVTMNAELFGAPFRAGLSSIGDGTDVTLQTGRYFGKNAALRYGLYRSKLGLGGELHKGRFSLEGNVWDFNKRSTNAYLGFKLTPNLEVLAGRENIRGVHANTIGVRLRP